jgi:putative ABC transport system permease protein
MRLTTIAWKNLLRRRTRTLLTMAGLAIAVAAVVALVGISDGFERSYLDLYSDRQIDIVVQRGGNAHNLNRSLDYELGDRLRPLSGVKEVLPGQMDVVSFPEFELTSVFAIGWEPQSRLFRRLNTLSGRGLTADDHLKALIGKVLAANMGKKVGDRLEMYGEQIEIVGVVDSPSVFENGAVLMPLRELQRLMNTTLVTGFSVSVDHPENEQEVADVQQRIQQMDSTLVALPVGDFVRSIGEIRLARTVAWAISAIALFIGAIGMLNTMVMSVAERVREIGTLRAIGWTKRRVVTVILCESLLLSLGGAAIGTVAAIGLTHFLSGLPAVSGLVQGRIAPAVMFEGLLVSLAVGVMGAVYPAYWGANLPPTEALRHR